MFPADQFCFAGIQNWRLLIYRLQKNPCWLLYRLMISISQISLSNYLFLLNKYLEKQLIILDFGQLKNLSTNSTNIIQRIFSNIGDEISESICFKLQRQKMLISCREKKTASLWFHVFVFHICNEMKREEEKEEEEMEEE